MADQSPRRPKFYPTPGYIIDLGLSGGRRDLLDVVAGHDGFGANGRHCDASQIILARESNLTKWTVSRYLAEFVEAGVLSKHAHPSDGREAVYEVVYQPSPENVAQMRNYFVRARKREVAEASKDRAKVVALEIQQTAEIIGHADTQYIPLRGKEKKRPPVNTESPRRARALGARARAAGGHDSAVDTEEKNACAREAKKSRKSDDDLIVNIEVRKALEAKKSREALASKAGKDPSEFDTLTWCAWLNLTYGYDRNAAADLIVHWACDARQDLDRVKRALCEAHTRKPPDVEAFMAERLKGLGS